MLAKLDCRTEGIAAAAAAAAVAKAVVAATEAAVLMRGGRGQLSEQADPKLWHSIAREQKDLSSEKRVFLRKVKIHTVEHSTYAGILNRTYW